jgi:hypothetical protein
MLYNEAVANTLVTNGVPLISSMVADSLLEVLSDCPLMTMLSNTSELT